MIFGDTFDLLLPNYLVEAEKGRLKEALVQFTQDKKGVDIDYRDFFKSYNHSYFLQSDLLREIRSATWDDSQAEYYKVYNDAIIVSNTCDLSFDNKRALNQKECLFAPLIDFSEYLKDLSDSGYDPKKLKIFESSVKAQQISNIFYIPNSGGGEVEYISFLDNLFWFPTEELSSYIEEIEKNRIASLSLFGHYLFILKLSYHLCRLPETCDREVI